VTEADIGALAIRASAAKRTRYDHL